MRTLGRLAVTAGATAAILFAAPVALAADMDSKVASPHGQTAKAGIPILGSIPVFGQVFNGLVGGLGNGLTGGSLGGGGLLGGLG